MGSQNRIAEVGGLKSQMAELPGRIQAEVASSAEAVKSTVQEYPLVATAGALALGLIAGAALGALLAPSRQSSYLPTSGWPADLMASLKQHLPSMPSMR